MHRFLSNKSFATTTLICSGSYCVLGSNSHRRSSQERCDSQQQRFLHNGYRSYFIRLLGAQRKTSYSCGVIREAELHCSCQCEVLSLPGSQTGANMVQLLSKRDPSGPRAQLSNSALNTLPASGAEGAGRTLASMHMNKSFKDNHRGLKL